MRGGGVIHLCVNIVINHNLSNKTTRTQVVDSQAAVLQRDRGLSGGRLLCTFHTFGPKATVCDERGPRLQLLTLTLVPAGPH